MLFKTTEASGVYCGLLGQWVDGTPAACFGGVLSIHGYFAKLHLSVSVGFNSAHEPINLWAVQCHAAADSGLARQRSTKTNVLATLGRPKVLLCRDVQNLRSAKTFALARQGELDLSISSARVLSY